MDLLDIPGFAEAVIKERLVRDAAFIGITESLGPFEVVPLTLRHWIILRLVHNPLLTSDNTPSPDDLVNFLWLLSTSFSPTDKKAKRHFERHCQRIFFPPRYMALWNTKRARARHEVRRQKKLAIAAKIIDAARAYMAESLQDRPPAPIKHGFEDDYYSDAAYFCATFGREFGWSQEETLNTPLKRLFQYLNQMNHYHRSPVPLCNPSDRIKAAWLRTQQPKRSPPNGH